MTEETERSEIRYQNAGDISFPGTYYGFIPETAMSHRVGVLLGDTSKPGKGVNFIDAKDDAKQILSSAKDIRKGVKSDNGQIYWNPAGGVYVAKHVNTFVFVGDNYAYKVFTRFGNDFSNGDYDIYPYDDFTVLAIARKNENMDLGFICGWAGNAFDHLRVYEGKTYYEPFELDLDRYIREDVRLTTDANFGVGPALTMGANASIRVPYEWTFTWLTENGRDDLETGRQEKTSAWSTSKDSASLWFKVRK